MLGRATTASQRRYCKNRRNGENGRRTRRSRERRARRPFLNRHFLSRQNFASSIVLNLFRRVSVQVPTLWSILERYPVCPAIESATPKTCSLKFVSFHGHSHRRKGGLEQPKEGCACPRERESPRPMESIVQPTLNEHTVVPLEAPPGNWPLGNAPHHISQTKHFLCF